MKFLIELLPIGGLLVVIAFVVHRLPSVDVGHSRAFKIRRVMNWLPLGLTYAFLYMGRYNINVASAEGFLTKAELGDVTLFGTLTYAVSFLVNGALTDIIGGRKTIMIAAVGACIANAAMGYYVLTGDIENPVMVFGLLYSINMYFQSFGAVSIVKVNAPWFHVRERGVFGGIFGILISLGIFFAYDGNRFFNKTLGLDAPVLFFAPAIMLAIFAVIDYFLVFDSPEKAGLEDFELGDNTRDSDMDAHKLPFVKRVYTVLKLLLSNPVIRLIAVIELFSGFVRGGVFKWGFFFTAETGQEFITNHWGAFLCAAGILGGVFAGTISDKVFQSRRGPSVVIMWSLIAVSLGMALMFITSPVAPVILLGSFMSIIGVHGMLSATASMDFAGRHNVGIAVGLIDGLVYVGYGLQSKVLGHLLPKKSEMSSDPDAWRVWFYVLLPAAVIGLLLSTRLWNAKPTGHGGGH